MENIECDETKGMSFGLNPEAMVVLAYHHTKSEGKRHPLGGGMNNDPTKVHPNI